MKISSHSMLIDFPAAISSSDTIQHDGQDLNHALFTNGLSIQSNI